METTQVHFTDHSDRDNIIMSVSYPGYPRFEKGDKITLQVNNNVPEKWDVEPIPPTEYIVQEVEHSALTYYGSGCYHQLNQFVYVEIA